MASILINFNYFKGVELKKRAAQPTQEQPIAVAETQEVKIWKDEKKMRHDSSHASLASRISIDSDEKHEETIKEEEEKETVPLNKSPSEESFHEIEEKKAPFIDGIYIFFSFFFLS